MAFITIPFGSSPQATLEPMGLRIASLHGNLVLDERSWFEPPLFAASQIQGWNYLQVGAFSSVSGGLLGHCEVGRYCAIAQEVVIGAHEHPTDWLSVSRITHVRGLHGWDRFLHPADTERVQKGVKPYNKSTRITKIGNDVWIGQRSFIRSGISIGDGAIIAAGSVVTKDVPPYAVMAGLPAKQKKSRFPDAVVERLLKLRWWQYDLYDFDQLPYDRIEESLDRIEEQVAAKGITPYTPEKITAGMLAQRFAKPALSVAGGTAARG